MNECNIITAILNIIGDHQKKIGLSDNTHNRLHAMGEPLEDYIKDVFSGSLGLSEQDKIKQHNKVFSYGGGKNNPPDAIIDHGDAIEVKKVETIGSIPLNSSYPKSKLYKDDARISSYCRDIEQGNWDVRDIIYAVGCEQRYVLKSIALVYGSVYCADKEYYEKVFNLIKQSINNTPLDLKETNELAHINAVDPLGITYFRARSMWGIYHPFKVYDYLFKHSNANQFELLAIIPTDKYESFPNRQILEKLSREDENLKIQDSQVKNPNNTMDLINIKLITYIK